MTAPLGPAQRHRLSAATAGLVLLAALLANGAAPAQDNPAPEASIRFLEIIPAPGKDSLPPLPPTPPEAPESPPVLVPVVDREESSAQDTHSPDSWDVFPTGNDLLQASCPGCKTTPAPFYAGPAPVYAGPAPMYPGPAPVPPPPGPHHGPKLRDTLFWGCLNCGVGECIPGRGECYPCCHTETAFGRFICNLYHCICCPDPCYEGKWQPIADSGFFVEAARPVSQTRLRWDRGLNLIQPDRSEFFWARADGMGKGPRPEPPALVVPRLRYHELSMYTEIATGMMSVIVEIPYRSINPEFAPHAAGFADMNTAIKTMIFDCELLQVSIMMRTYIPIGATFKGLGTGHVSLEPSLIFGIKLHPDAYFQGQIAEWIPLGGDPDYAGAVLHYHFSVNQVLYRFHPDVPLIGTLEFSGYSFQDGAFTDPVLGPWQPSSRDTYAYLGTGLRLFVCDRIDFGFGVNLALTSEHFADQLFRSEFRFRY